MISVRKAISRVAYAVAPSLAAYIGQRSLLSRELAQLVTRLQDARDNRRLAEIVLESPTFRPIQKPSEITRLLDLIQQLQPRTICEIGAARGGTLALFSRVAAQDARIVSIDLAYSRAQTEILPRFAKASQKIHCFAADSHSPGTFQRLKKWLSGDAIDLLFIDGDHSFEGVSADYQLFAPLVCVGGYVVFHDIHPDYRTRYGTPTSFFTGDVPRFWAELKSRSDNIVEFLEDPEQDGFGIGVLHRRAGEPWPA